MIYSKNKIFAIKENTFSQKFIDHWRAKKKNIFQNHDRDEFFDFAKIIQLITTIFNNFQFFDLFWLHATILYEYWRVQKKKYNVEIYHVKKNSINIDFRKFDIQHIMFFFKIFNDSKSRYWSTKIKIVCLIWTIKKIRHLIKTCQLSTICYINHFFITKIVNQIILFILFIDKLNFRFVRVSQYFSQFDFEIRHRSRKLNTIFDVFFKLIIDVDKNDNNKKEILNETWIYNENEKINVVNHLQIQIVKKKIM